MADGRDRARLTPPRRVTTIGRALPFNMQRPSRRPHRLVEGIGPGMVV
jgi:hypothetical protein